MSIWKTNPTLEYLNELGRGSLQEHLGIEFTEIGTDYIKARMPVDHRTKQPMGLIHGGASAALSETMGSIAGVLIIEDMTKQSIVGIEINANHLSSAKSGYVYATTKPVKIGRRLQVWNTEIHDEDEKLICTSRLTTMIIEQ